MEADWAVEVGAGLPVIDADWTGFVDLQQDPGAVESLPELQACPALSEALNLLNARGSGMFTSKCDVWAVSEEELDPFEYDADAARCRAGMAAYIDVLLRDRKGRQSFSHHERGARAVAMALRPVALPQARVDVVVREARFAGEEGFGITLYLAGCGAGTAEAGQRLAEVLRLAAAVTMERIPHTGE